jgi:hypothetical protein
MIWQQVIDFSERSLTYMDVIRVWDIVPHDRVSMVVRYLEDRLRHTIQDERLFCKSVVAVNKSRGLGEAFDEATTVLPNTYTLDTNATSAAAALAPAPTATAAAAAAPEQTPSAAPKASHFEDHFRRGLPVEVVPLLTTAVRPVQEQCVHSGEVLLALERGRWRAGQLRRGRPPRVQASRLPRRARHNPQPEERAPSGKVRCAALLQIPRTQMVTASGLALERPHAP